MRAALANLPRALTPLALAAGGLALVFPSPGLADRSDLLLALLVALTALGISASDLARLRARPIELLALSVLPLLVLAGVGWAVGRPFPPSVAHGVLAVGLASTEVACVGLVALAGADAAIALGVVTGSLIAAAVLGPLLIGVLGGAHAGGTRLLGRFAIVVLVPGAAGIAARTRWRALGRLDAEREGLSALTVVVLVFAALGGAAGGRQLPQAFLASATFLAVSAALGALWWRMAPGDAALEGAFAIGLRDFAVAAALATQAFGPAAGTVPGAYGLLMLVGGALTASVAARRRSRSRAPASRPPAP